MWEQRALAGDYNAATTLHTSVTCMHHGACLAKKPGLLAVPGLCSNMVRLTRAMQSSKFQENFGSALDYVASKMLQRRVVVSIPQHASRWRSDPWRRRAKL